MTIPITLTNRFAAILILAPAACGVALAACGPAPDAGSTAGSASAETVVSTAVLMADVDLAACLAAARDEPGATGVDCSGFILLALGDAIERCSGIGGDLAPMTSPVIWSLDVDADGTAEVLFDVTRNYSCYGAPSALSCGSLGCPTFLYARQGDAWAVLGHMNTGDARGAEVLAATEGTRFGTLRGGCSGERPCDELTLYTWDGSSYQRTAIDVRGHRVSVAPGGLWTLTQDAPVLAMPAAAADVLSDYPAGTQMVVLGDARDAPYRYVSPCNDCQRGFVATDALTRETTP